MLSETVRPAIVMRIDTPVPTRIWSGSFPRDIPADDVETEGGVYLGLGLTDLPVFDRLLDGDAGEYTFSVSGVGSDALALIGEPETFSGALVHIGQFAFDSAWQPIGAVEWISTYEAETIGFATETDADGERSAVVQMTVATAFTDRRRPRLVHWSAIENAAVNPADRAYEHVNRYSLGTRRQYPA